MTDAAEKEDHGVLIESAFEASQQFYQFLLSKYETIHL